MAKKKKNRKVVKKIDKQPIQGLYQQAIAMASGLFRDGSSEQKVAEVIKANYLKLSDPNIQLVLHKASVSIASEHVRDRKNIVPLHVKRYNKEIKKIMDAKDSWKLGGDPEYDDDDIGMRRKIRIYKLTTCLDVMLSKEKVLQLHNKETQVKIFNKLNATIKEKKVMFNLEGLTLDEKIEFLMLITKAKKSQQELLSIKMMDRKEEVTEDVEYEVVQEDNISKIKKVNTEKQKALPPPATTTDDITDKLKRALLKKAAEEFKAKGASEDKGPKILDYRKKN